MVSPALLVAVPVSVRKVGARLSVETGRLVMGGIVSLLESLREMEPLPKRVAVEALAPLAKASSIYP